MKNKVRYYRQELRITQEQLGKILRVTRQTIGALEHGRFDPPITMAYYISLILKQPLDEIFDFESLEILEINIEYDTESEKAAKNNLKLDETSKNELKKVMEKAMPTNRKTI